MTRMTRKHVDTAGWISGRDPLPVSRWCDRVGDGIGFDPRSDYVETYWVVVLGPSCVLAARRLADWLDASPEGLEIDLETLGRTLGLGGSAARRSQLIRTLCRLVDFGLATINRDTYSVAALFPPLARRHLKRLPDYLLAHHLADLTEHLTRVHGACTPQAQR